MIGPDGRLWWTTAQAVDQLVVNRFRLADWVRRSKKAGHVPGQLASDCPACPAAGFPHVDPPHRAGQASAWPAEQLLDAEAYTWASRRGGVSRGVT